LSNIGVQVVPLLTVFQTLPDATATYQVLDFIGSLTMSLIRPDRWAGPIFRNDIPLKVSELNFVFPFSSASSPARNEGARRITKNSQNKKFRII
jgi:hypothetical protein